MTVQELYASAQLCVYTAERGELEIESGYCGDFLSNVIGRAPANCAWLTVMNNINVAAVATLIECACVILCEGVQPDDQLLSRAKTQKINLLGSQKNAYQTAKLLSETCDV